MLKLNKNELNNLSKELKKKQKKYYVIIDDIEEYTEKGKFVNAIVYFSIYNGEETILESFMTFDYDDADTQSYISDIEEMFREIGEHI